MEIRIRMIIDDRFNYHYRVDHQGKVNFLMGSDHVSADSRLVDYLRRRLGMPVEMGIGVCERFISEDEIVIDLSPEMCN